jgi:hypothetical protein
MQKKILIVEDNELMVEVMTYISITLKPIIPI